MTYWPLFENASVAIGQYGDVDNSISKFLIMQMEGDSTDKDYFQLAFGKRPDEAFYVIAKDPYNLKNDALHAKYKNIRHELRKERHLWMRRSHDLRAIEPYTDYWDKDFVHP